MSYQGTFELQPIYDGRRSFYGKAFVERWSTDKGTQLVLKSYGTVVAEVTPITSIGIYPAIYDVAVNMDVLSAMILPHVREFLAQTDDVFRGIQLDWLRDKVNGERVVDNGDVTRYRNLYAMHNTNTTRRH